MNPGIHKAGSVEDAINMLDTRIPLLHREIVEVCESLFEAGRQDGIAGVTSRIKRTANRIEADDAAAPTRPQQRFVQFLWDLARILESDSEVAEARAEYQDPTHAIRERLTKIRASKCHKGDNC